MTTFIYTILVLSHIWSPKKANPEEISLMVWWKWCSYLWTMILWWNVIITLVFWCFLLPSTDFANRENVHPWGAAKLCLDHILPITITLIDWSLNAFVFDKQHILTQMPVFVFYGLVNLAIVKITGFVIYPGITWNSFLSYLLAAAAIPAGFAIWYFLAWCTNKKTLRLL